MLLSVCMVTNDKGKTIMRTIKSVRGIADEIILVDRDSMDSTRKIAEELGVKVYRTGRDTSFRESHNLAKEKAGGKWILLLEGDEELLDDLHQLRAVLKNTDSTGFYLPGINIGFAGKMKSKTDNSYSLPRLSLRLYRNRKEYRYTDDSYESITASILKVNGEATLRILHLPIVKRNIYSLIPEELRPLSLFFFQSGEDEGIILEEDALQYLRSGIKSFQQGEISEAIARLEKAYTLAGTANRVLILQNLLLVLLEDKQYKRVEEQLRTGLEDYPDNIIFLFWQGYLEYIKGEYISAINCFKYLLGRLSLSNNLDRKLLNNSYFLLALSLFANNKREEACFYLEKAFLNDKANKLIINLLLEIKGIDIDELFDFFQLDNPANRELLFSLFECLLSRKEYELLQLIYERQNIIRNDENRLLYWKGLSYLKQKKYHMALKHFKMIKPDFPYYQNVLYLQWILNLIMPGRIESKSIVNQIKLLGDRISWTIINYFNEIYFYERGLFFSFDHQVAKLKFYNTALYLLDRLMEYSTGRSIIIMMELINSLGIPGTINDIGFLFYIHGYLEEAYEYLKIANEKGEFPMESSILAEICRKKGYFSEEKKWKEKSEYLDSCPEVKIQCRKFALFVEY